MNDIKTNSRADGSFNGMNPHTLMTDYSYLIDSKQYAGMEKKFLTLYADVLSSNNGMSDKMDIFCLQRVEYCMDTLRSHHVIHTLILS